MKKLLVLPLLLGFTSAVNAETWYLLGKTSAGTWTVPMPSEDQCNAEGKRFNNLNRDSEWEGFKSNAPAYICLKGK